jgi:hypothetical protein
MGEMRDKEVLCGFEIELLGLFSSSLLHIRILKFRLSLKLIERNLFGCGDHV